MIYNIIEDIKMLTKTDFIQFLHCPESLWLLKHKPDLYPKGEFSLFLEKLVKEGYEVEEQVKKLFPKGIDLPNDADPTYTKSFLEESDVLFQASFITDAGIFARVDVIEKLDDGTYHLYEVKSSTSIKTDKKHNHIKDACFQKYVLECNGLDISRVSIIHLNGDYVREEELIPEDLLFVDDVTQKILELEDAVEAKINSALLFLKKEVIDETSCSCKLKTRSNHCDCFEYFNPNTPKHNIYQLNRISAKKVKELVELDSISLVDVPENFDLSLKQQVQLESFRKDSPVVDKPKIKELLDNLRFPLHFYDYETYASAIPLIDGMSPHKHLVFQVSMHTLAEDGRLTHYEYLADKLEMPHQMLHEMRDLTGLEGTFISWHASFENSRNMDMMVWMPEYRNYLDYINNHTFDLEGIFKDHYVDHSFNGSTSIKKVLPVICPDLSYEELSVGDGTTALDTWGRMVLDPEFSGDIEETRKNLLEYCKLDSLAMVRIYEFLFDQYI